MKTLYVILFLLGSLFRVAAQRNEPEQAVIKVTGRVMDSLSRQPVAYATINFYGQDRAKPSGGAMTGSKGTFSMSGLPTGNYTVTVECIGYGTRTVGPFAADGKRPALVIGDISLLKKATDLQAATVTATRGLVENKLDKMVYNAEKDVTSLGGVATDLLKKVPMVSVDVDGNVDIMGYS